MLPKRTFTFLSTLVVLALAAAPVPASASIILLADDANCAGCSNVLFQVGNIGNPLTAATQGGKQVVFSQAALDGALFAPSNGQARLTQDAGSPLDFHGLSIDLGQTTTTLFEFTVQPLSGQVAGKAESMNVTMNDNLGNVFFFTLGSVGQNRHTWQAIDGQTISNVQIDFVNGTVQAVEQIRLSEGVGDPAPEPVTTLLLGGGLLALGLVRRRIAAR